MSLVASAHMRMKKKREKEKATTAAATTAVQIPIAAYSSPTPSPGIISPHNAAASTICGNENADGWNESLQTQPSPALAAPCSDEVQYEYDAAPSPALPPAADPPMRTPSAHGEDEQLNVSSSAASSASGQALPRRPHSDQFDAVSPGVVDAQHHRTPSEDPPQTQQPHSSLHHAQRHPQPQHQHLTPPYHPPRPPMPILGRRPAYLAGTGSHDTPPEEEGHSHVQWRQQQSVSPSPSQHSSQHSQRGISPSPSPQYLHSAPMRGVGPPPSPNRDLSGHQNQSFDAITRHQGSYTHHLLPRNPQRVANRPRRRYDSFTGAPDDADEVDDSSVKQQQAFDPFAPSPLTLPNGVLNSDVHATHRASPLFHNGYPQHQFSSMVPSNPGMLGLPGGPVNNSGVYGNAPQPLPQEKQDTAAFQPSVPQPPPPKGLATIEGSNGIAAGFVYNDEVVRSNSYQEEDGEVAAANENINLNASDYFREHDPKNSLMNHYDFEYHTKKDEGSTFSDEGAPFTSASLEEVPPLPPDGRPVPLSGNNMPPSKGEDPSEVADENQTVDSETALYGTPVMKKKEHTSKTKKRRGYRSKIIIDNVVKAHVDGERQVAGGGMDKVSIVSGGTGRQQIVNGENPRYAMHHPEDENALFEESPNSLLASEEGSLRQSEDESHHSNVGGLASLAKDQPSAKVPVATAEIDSLGHGDTEEQMLQPPSGKRNAIRLPPRLPISKSGEGNAISSQSAAESVQSGSDFGIKSFRASHEKDQVDSRSNNTGVSTDDRQFLSPSRIDQSKSWDSQDKVPGNKHVGVSGSFGSFAKNLVWDDKSLIGLQPDVDTNDTKESGDLRRRGNQFSKPSEMLDCDVSAGEAPLAHVMQVESTGTWGTWGEQTATLFGDVAGVEARVESDKENLFQQQDDAANERALAEWDRAEAEWRASTSAAGDVTVGDDGGPQPTEGDKVSLPPSPKMHRHPWDSESDPAEFGMFEPEPSVFSELTSSVQVGRRERTGAVKFSENGLLIDDEDSIFNFDKKRQENDSSEDGGTSSRQDQQQQQLQTKSIFSQINSSLKQADKTKSRALGIHPAGSEERTDFEEDQERCAQEQALLQTVQESTASETGSILSDGDKKNRTSGKRISFMEKPPMVHTYLAPKESSESEKDSDRYYDDEEDEESNMGNFALDKSAPAVSLTEKNVGRLPGKSLQKQPVHSSQEAPGSLGDTNDNGLSNHDDDTFGDSTLEDTVSYKSGLSDTRKGGDDDVTSGGGTGDGGGGSGGELGFIEHVEVGFAAVGGLLGGLFGVGPAVTAVAPAVQVNETKGQTRTNGARGNDEEGGSKAARKDATVEDVTVEDEKTLETEGDDDGTYGESTSTHYTERTGVESEYDWLGYMKNIIFPKDTDGGMSVMSGDLGTRYSDTYEADSAYHEDEDSYLLQQALAAARAIHHVQGVEYDETQEINVLTDIKFVVVTVALPLGLLFQEHEIGVWVSRVVPDGNGARKGVQHGDQLAAINGSSSVHTTIDEVATTISGANSSGVELTFLRYVGPLRPVPGSIIQEGFEVTDTSVSPKREKTKQQDKEKSKRGLFSKKRIPSKTNSNSNNTPPSSPGRKFGLDISPKSPKRMPSSRASPKYISSTHGSSPKASLSATSASSSRASSSSRHSPLIPSLNAGQLQPQSARPSAKKKKSLGKLIPFKKKG